MSNIKISIIVPVYNVEKYIERCARSLFEQTMRDGIEFIFVDDRSPDNSMELLKNVILSYPERQNAVKIIHNAENLRQAGARHAGLLQATGEYVLNVDSDDWIEPEMAEQMYEAALKNNADVVACELKMETDNESIELRYPVEVMNEDTDFSKISLKEPYALFASICIKMVRRELLLQNEIILDRSITQFEDTATTFYLRVMGKNFTRIHGTYYHYEKSNGQSMTQGLTLNKVMERVRAIQKCERFLQEHELTEKYQRTLNLLKFASKTDMLLLPDILQVKIWRQTYPVSNRLAFSYPNLNCFTRLIFIFAYLHLDFFAKRLSHMRAQMQKRKGSRK